MITGTERDNTLYKKDAFAQAWVDRRYIATMITWMESQGVQPKFMAEVLNTALVTIVEGLVSQGKVSRVQFTEEADKIINRTIRTNLNPSNRGKRYYAYNLQLDGARLELLNKSEGELRYSQKQDASTSDADEAMRREVERLIKGGI